MLTAEQGHDTGRRVASDLETGTDSPIQANPIRPSLADDIGREAHARPAVLFVTGIFLLMVATTTEPTPCIAEQSEPTAPCRLDDVRAEVLRQSIHLTVAWLGTNRFCSEWVQIFSLQWLWAFRNGSKTHDKLFDRVSIKFEDQVIQAASGLLPRNRRVRTTRSRAEGSRRHREVDPKIALFKVLLPLERLGPPGEAILVNASRRWLSVPARGPGRAEVSDILCNAVVVSSEPEPVPALLRATETAGSYSLGSGCTRSIISLGIDDRRAYQRIKGLLWGMDSGGWAIDDIAGTGKRAVPFLRGSLRERELQHSTLQIIQKLGPKAKALRRDVERLTKSKDKIVAATARRALRAMRVSK